MTLLRKYYEYGGYEGGGMPDEVQSKIDNLCNLNQEPLYREGVFDGYSLASEELARLKEENERLRGQGGWISVKHRLPEYMDSVIVCGLLGEVTEAQYTGHENEFQSGEYTIRATNWQPLPKPPSPTKK